MTQDSSYKGELMPLQIPPDNRPMPNPGGTQWHHPTFQEQFAHFMTAYGWGLLEITITLALALLVRRKWPGIIWISILAGLDIAAWIMLPEWSARRAEMLPHAVMFVAIYFVARFLRWRKTG